MANSDKSRGDQRLAPAVNGLALVLLVVAIFYLAQEVLLPFALAVLLSFLLTPLATRLQRWGLGRIGAVVVTVALAFAVIGGLGYVIFKHAVTVASELPKYEKTLVAKVKALRKSSSPNLGGAAATVGRIEKAIVGTESGDATRKTGSGFNLRDAVFGEEPLPVRVIDSSFAPLRVLSELAPLFTILGSGAIVVVFVIFILLERENLRDRIIRLAGTSRVYVTTQALEDAAKRVSKYLLMQLIINSIYGAVIGTGLYCIGLPNAILWGLLGTILRFLPYVGPMISAVTPIALSLAVFEGWERPLATMALFIVTELVTNNVLEPWLYGSSTGVSTLAIVTAAVFWTWLWGPVGLVLATPLTVCLTVMARHVPQLGFLNILLADEPPLELKYRFYQRLLAENFEDASEVASEFLREGSLDELYATMFVPALTLAERDRDAGRLSSDQEAFVYESVAELVDEMHDEFALSGGKKAETDAGEEIADVEEPPAAEPRRVVCIALEDEADRIAAIMLSQLLAARGYASDAPERSGASEEVLRRFETEPIDGIVVSTIAPSGSVRLRSMCRKLRRRAPRVKIVVGLWNAPARLERMNRSLERTGIDFLTTSFEDALRYLEEAIPPRPPVAPRDPKGDGEATKTAAAVETEGASA